MQCHGCLVRREDKGLCPALLSAFLCDIQRSEPRTSSEIRNHSAMCGRMDAAASFTNTWSSLVLVLGLGGAAPDADIISPLESFSVLNPFFVDRFSIWIGRRRARTRRWSMPDDPIEYLVLDRCDSDGNMARFYVRSVEASLFGDAALIRKWGRIGTAGQRRGELHKG